jgi:hypothetical protein
MATQGPRYPSLVFTDVGPSGDNDWLNEANVGADDGSEAQITAATYDAGDHSYRLVASGLGFSIPNGATVNGVVVEIDRRCFAGAAQDQEVRLYNSSGPQGTDKQTATAWPATSAVATYGSSSDTWGLGAGLTPGVVNDINFGVCLIVLADGANTDIGVDYIRMTVYYTEAAPTGTATVTVDEATVAASGSSFVPVTGTGAPSIDEATVAASGTVANPVTGTGTITTDEATLAAAGSEGMTGTAAVAVDEATLAAVGEHDAGGPAPVTGTSAITADEAVLAAAGAERFTGTAAVAMDETALAASGQVLNPITGSGAVTLDEPVVTSSGSELLSGAVTLILDEPVLSAIGLVIVPVTGTGAISVEEAVLAAVAEVPIPIAGNPLELTQLWVLRRFLGLRHVR